MPVIEPGPEGRTYTLTVWQMASYLHDHSGWDSCLWRDSLRDCKKATEWVLMAQGILEQAKDEPSVPGYGRPLPEPPKMPDGFEQIGMDHPVAYPQCVEKGCDLHPFVL